MAVPRLLPLLLAGGLLLGAAAGGRADTLPVPTEPLKDYEGQGLILLDLPAPAPVQTRDGEKIITPGVSTFVQFIQAYVWPDRLYLELAFGGAREINVVQANTERRYSPAVGYVVETTYKNLEQAPQNPITAVQLSMATYAKLVREL